MRTSRSLETFSTLQATAQVVQETFATLRGRVDVVDLSSGAAPDVEDLADLALVGERSACLDRWRVSVYLYDLGDTCGVELVALGGQGFRPARRDGSSTPSLARSVRRMQTVLAALRAEDPRARLIG